MLHHVRQSGRQRHTVPVGPVASLGFDTAAERYGLDLNTGPWTLELVTSMVTEQTLEEYSRPAAR